MTLDLNFQPQRIKGLRHRLGLTQTQFAKELGVAQSTVALWETGRRHPGHAAVLEALLRLEQDGQKVAPSV